MATYRDGNIRITYSTTGLPLNKARIDLIGTGCARVSALIDYKTLEGFVKWFQETGPCLANPDADEPPRRKQ